MNKLQRNKIAALTAQAIQLQNKLYAARDELRIGKLARLHGAYIAQYDRAIDSVQNAIDLLDNMPTAV